MEYLTCLGLLNYPDAPLPAGLELRPEAARRCRRSAPTVGHIRSRSGPGCSSRRRRTSRSPPRHSVHRSSVRCRRISSSGLPVCSSSTTSSARRRSGTAQATASTGLKAEGDKLTITLEAPTPGFLKRLSLPFYCPVPARDTSDSPRPRAPDPPVAARAVLPGDAPPIPARRLQEEPELPRGSAPACGCDRDPPAELGPDLLSGVQGGLIDGALLPGGDSLVGPGGTLAAQWGPTSEAGTAGDQRWFGARRFGRPTSPSTRTARRSRTSSVRASGRARRSIERAAPVSGDGVRLLASCLPSSPGPDVPGPDLDGAKVLMAGRKLTVTMAAGTGLRRSARPSRQSCRRARRDRDHR